MDHVTQQNAAMAEQSSAASQSLSHETEQLAGLIGQFRVGQASGSGSVVAIETRSQGNMKGAAQKPHKDDAAIRAPKRELRTAPGRQISATARKPDPETESWEEF